MIMRGYSRSPDFDRPAFAATYRALTVFRRIFLQNPTGTAKYGYCECAVFA